MVILFKNQTTNGDSTVYTVKRPRKLVIRLDGTFDNCQVLLKSKINSAYSDWIQEKYTNGEDMIFIEPTSAATEELPKGFQIKATLQNAGGSTDVTIEVLEL